MVTLKRWHFWGYDITTGVIFHSYTCTEELQQSWATQQSRGGQKAAGSCCVLPRFGWYLDLQQGWLFVALNMNLKHLETFWLIAICSVHCLDCIQLEERCIPEISWDIFMLALPFPLLVQNFQQPKVGWLMLIQRRLKYFRMSNSFPLTVKTTCIDLM